MIFNISPNAFMGVVTCVLLLIATGAAVPAAILRQNSAAYKERASQTEKELGEVRDELKDLSRDFRELKTDHEALKDKYIQVLEESRSDNRTLITDVRHELREMRKLLAK